MTKHDEELKRLQRLVVACFFIVLLSVIGFVAFISYMAKDIQVNNERYIDIKIKDIRVVDGKDGLTIVGPPGESIKGDTGATGKDGKDSDVPGPAGPAPTAAEIYEQVAAFCAANNNCKGDTGSTGAQGEPGPQGRTVYQRTNPLTGQEECRYSGSREWMPATECEG